MKTIFNSIYSIIVMLIVLIISACSEDNSTSNDAMPRINYVRITKPTASDSLLVKGGQGALIAIIGENLQNSRAIWFNDREGYLQPTYVTNTSILTKIPGRIPSKVTNMLYLISASNDTLKYPFIVDIGEPYIKNMRSEYVAAGKIASITGDFFYEPITVTFAGGVEGTISSIVDDKILNVVVPEGALPGPITIKTNFGETISDFYFRDNRNIFVSSDPYKGYSGDQYVVSAPDATAPEAINGNYIRINKTVGSYEWTPFAEGSPEDFGAEGKAIPDAAILHPEDYYLKFEVNTQKPFNNNGVKFQVAMADGIVADNKAYYWNPPFDTKSKWETVSISFEEVLKNIVPKVSARGYYVRLLVHGDGSLDADMSFDNFRVVPKFLDLN